LFGFRLGKIRVLRVLREVRGPDFAAGGLSFPCVGQSFGGGSAPFRPVERQANYESAMQGKRFAGFDAAGTRSMCRLQPRPAAAFCNVVGPSISTAGGKGSNANDEVEGVQIATWMSSPSTRTAWLATSRGAGAPSTAPLVTSKTAPCHGQVTSVPTTIPSERGPPR
jgi:hypothetical protein